jgi:hypothetical protein
MKELLKMLAREILVPMAIAAGTKFAAKKLAPKDRPAS